MLTAFFWLFNCQTPGYKGNYLSFNWTKSDHQNNDAFIKNYKYSFPYFANKYCNAPGTVGLLYQKTIIY